MKKIIGIIFLLFSIHHFINAQQNYPQGYFRNPLNIPIQLAANFGELRTDHFHMGLDIRTQGRENLPVFAAADGYVSRIKIEKYGYGRAIYINHPNGYTTLYAHLNSFYDALEQYVKSKQYKDKKWEQDIELPANLFPVVKGQFIANSGNTGGSAGPHLHFEIRDTKTENNLDPLLFGMPLQDNIPPIVYGLFWYDRRFSAYKVIPQPISIIKKNGVYTSIGSVVKVGSPVVSLGIRMEDMNNASSFKFGVYHAALYVDDALQFEFKLNDFSYDDSRYVNASMDYTRWVKNKQGIQYLSVLPGNKINIFTPPESDGRIILSDSSTHKIKIVLSDEKQNTTTVSFLMKYDEALQKNYSLPANATVCDVNSVNNIKTDNASIHFDEKAFYDALPLVVYETPSTTAKQVSPTIHTGDYSIPVHDDYNVMIKASALNNALKDKVVMQLKSGSSTTVKKGVWQGDWMLSSFDELGDERLLIDTIAPAIISVAWSNGSTFISQKALIIKCTDDVSRIANFTAMLDGNWLMFAKKNDYFTYTFDGHCAKGPAYIGNNGNRCCR
jgi:hypothetical protein